MHTSPPTDNGRTWAVRANRWAYHLSQQWGWWVSLLLGLFIGLPWLAPVFRHWGWDSPANAIYTFYSTQCHQFPQRSFFLFGEQTMYSMNTIQTIWQNSSNPLILRQFTGNPTLGWKVAWSDRMVYMYTSLLTMGLLYWPFRKRIKPLPWWGLVLFLLPMAIDGTTHMISDMLGGVGDGFRYHNEWLAKLTNHALANTFYVGDQLGSFNAWMRFLSGLFFGIGVVWFVYPHLHAAFSNTGDQIKDKFVQAGQTL